MLVVRVIAYNGSTSASDTALSNSVFGNDVDPVNLSSQYAACSHNQLEFVKAADTGGVLYANSITNGVVTVTVDTTVADGDAAMRNAITNKLNSDVKVVSPNQLADYVCTAYRPVRCAALHMHSSIRGTRFTRTIGAHMCLHKCMVSSIRAILASLCTIRLKQETLSFTHDCC